MALKLKLDEKGMVVLQEEKPVYIDDTDGRELAFDAEQVHKKILDLNKENASHRMATKAAEEKLKLYGERTPEEINTVFTAINDVGGLDGLATLKKKGSIDTDTLKKSMEDAYNSKVKDLETVWGTKLSEKEKALLEKDATIYKLMVSGQFSTSKYLNDYLTLPPDIAEATFGKHFKVEGGNVVAYLGEHPILSREKPGENAPFDEALQEIVDSYPMKDRILKVKTGSGSGAGGNSGNGGGSTAKEMKRTEFMRMNPTDQMTFSKAGGKVVD